MECILLHFASQLSVLPFIERTSLLQDKSDRFQGHTKKMIIRCVLKQPATKGWQRKVHHALISSSFFCAVYIGSFSSISRHRAYVPRCSAAQDCAGMCLEICMCHRSGCFVIRVGPKWRWSGALLLSVASLCDSSGVMAAAQGQNILLLVVHPLCVFFFLLLQKIQAVSGMLGRI